MKNHYSTLGISRNASKYEIKIAYKKLALRYHPDRNSDNARAEELFKAINEAYQILRDPEKKEKYDILLDFSLYEKKPQIQTYYQPYTYSTYRSPSPRPKIYPTYRFDRTYFKHQALAISIVLLISIIVISVTQFNQYLENIQREEIRLTNQKVLSAAHTKFNMGDFYGALQMVQQLADKNPVDFELDIERDKMTQELYAKARNQFVQQDYHNAIFNLLIVKEFQHPQKMEIYEYLARCYMAIEDYQRAIAAYEYIYIRNQTNMDLVMRIGMLYHYQMQDLNKSVEYYDKAKRLFKERQKQLYGKAFELLMDPQTTPNIYYELFFHRARANMEIRDYETAITDCNWATFLRPTQPEAYFMRAFCYGAIKEPQKACKDYNRALQKGLLPEPEFNYCNDV